MNIREAPFKTTGGGVMDDDCAVIDRLYEAFNKRDIDTVISLTHPDIEAHPLRTESTTPVRGRDAVRALMEKGIADGRTHRYDVHEVRQLDDGRVLVLATMVEFGISLAVMGIHRLEDGLNRHATQQFTDEETLAALGRL